MQLELLAEIVSASRAEAPGVVVEAGGGLRRAADVAAVLERADEAILGTAAIEDPEFLRASVTAHPGRIAVSLDVRDGRPALDGWSRTGEADVVALARRLLADGASRLIVTDTSRDGTLAGPNLALMSRVRSAVPDATLVAAGGIGSVDDLRAISDVGCDGAVVGLALLTGAIDPAEAMAVVS
jgi:phosphoribosylformimino-5-aminoimidazole carboxamide ribotide isomerase